MGGYWRFAKKVTEANLYTLLNKSALDMQLLTERVY